MSDTKNAIFFGLSVAGLGAPAAGAAFGASVALGASVAATLGASVGAACGAGAGDGHAVSSMLRITNRPNRVRYCFFTWNFSSLAKEGSTIAGRFPSFCIQLEPLRQKPLTSCARPYTTISTTQPPRVRAHA